MLLKKIDTAIMKAIEFIARKLCYFTGRNNFWFARLFWLISMIVLVSACVIFLIQEIANGSVRSIITGAILVPIILLGSYSIKWGIDTLEIDAEKNNNRNFRAIDIVVYRHRKSFEVYRFFCMLTMLLMALLASLVGSMPEFEFVAKGFTLFAVSYFLTGLSMYFATCEPPSKDRFSIKEFLKSFKTPVRVRVE